MFDLPDAKRVCREDLKSRHSSRSPSPIPSETATNAAKALEKAYGLLELFTAIDPIPTNESTNLEHLDRDDEEEHEFEFRLFRSSGGNAHSNISKSTNLEVQGSTDRDCSIAQQPMKGQAIQKVRIRLRSPSPTRAGEGGFVIPFRPWDYYFSDPESVFRVLCGDKSNSGSLKYKLLHTNRQTVKEQYLEAAVTYDELFAAARPGTWPGCQYPWRVKHITLASATAAKQSKDLTATTISTATSTSNAKKKKPNKRKRILIRRSTVAKSAADEAEKEKRARRNREKKLKRKLKEREKKATIRGAESGNAINANGSMEIAGDDKD